MARVLRFSSFLLALFMMGLSSKAEESPIVTDHNDGKKYYGLEGPGDVRASDLERSRELSKKHDLKRFGPKPDSDLCKT